MREADFSERIKTILCERVGGRCSNPNCRRETLGPHREGDKRLSIGEAAHILGASPKGARYDARMTKEERESINNGIWLCSACHTLIDKNPDEYPVEELLKWKMIAEYEQERRLKGEDIVSFQSQQMERKKEALKQVKYATDCFHDLLEYSYKYWKMNFAQSFSNPIDLQNEIDDHHFMYEEELCYYLFLSGFPTSEIAEILMDLGRKTKLGNTKWTGSTVVNVLRNERHCGDVLSRKTFTPNYLDHKSKKNNHDRNQYRQTDHHEAIVSREIYNAAQKMLDASKYMKKGYPLPTLQVVDQGALKGFVPVNRAWNGFSSADYEKASLSAYSENNNEICAEKTENRGFDLSGYEIVRAQFFSTRFDPAVTISSGKIVFNTACLKKFEDVEYVELLFNSVEKCIAVRPCERSSINAIKWGTIRDGRWAVLPKSCKGFSEPLYELMGWNKECKYKLRGQFCGSADEQVMIFELEEPEVLVQEKNAEQSAEEVEKKPEEAQKPVKKILYPEAWIYNFGESTNRTVFLQRVAYRGNWDILRPATTVEGMEIITREVLDDLLESAEKLIDKMRCANYA